MVCRLSLLAWGFCSGLLVTVVAIPSVAAAERPAVIGHRGACGYRPEHTLASYQLAIDQGADYLEPDLVATRNGVLICRHDCEIGATTDAATKFAGRKKTVTIGGKQVSGYFAEDFTLEELKTLRARERIPLRTHKYDGQFEIPTFEELLKLVARCNQGRKHPVGICPELKRPAYHRQRGVPLEEPLLALLSDYGYREGSDRCIIQSFETESLKRLAAKTELRLLQLLPNLPPDALPTDEQLREIASYAELIAAHKESILPRLSGGRLGKPTDLIARAHRAGLEVFVYTFRNELWALAFDYQGDPAAEIRRFVRLGADGLFTDFPDTAHRVLSGGER
jgi:glycerophosphoryl diester phosphodiesterase